MQFEPSSSRPCGLLGLVVPQTSIDPADICVCSHNLISMVRLLCHTLLSPAHILKHNAEQCSYTWAAMVEFK